MVTYVRFNRFWFITQKDIATYLSTFSPLHRVPLRGRGKKRKFNIQTRALNLRCNLFLGLPVLSYLLHWPNTRAIIILQLTVWQQNDIHMNNMTWAKYLHSSRTKEISHIHYTSNIQYTIMTNESTENCHPAVKKLCHPWIIYDMNTRQ